MNKTIDIHYIFEHPELANTAQEVFFFYQESTNKKEPWKAASTKKLPSKVSLHNLVCLREDPIDPSGNLLPEADLAKTPRVGPFNGDLDCAENPAKAVDEMKSLVEELINNYSVDPVAIVPYLSGSKGAGVIIDSRVFGEKYCEGHPDLADFQKELALELRNKFSTLDTGIYSKKRGRLNRRLNAKRENGRFRVAVTLADLALPAEELLKRTSAAGPKVNFPEEISFSSILAGRFEDFLQKKSVPTKARSAAIKSSSEPMATFESEISLTCIKELNTNDAAKISQDANYHHLSYLAARQLRQIEEVEASAQVAPFIMGWSSGAYPTESSRLEHFLKQHRSAREKSLGRACEAMRKALPTLNCVGCPHFYDEVYAMGAQLIFTESTLNRETMDAKGIRTEIFLANFLLSLEAIHSTISAKNTEEASILDFEIKMPGRVFTMQIRAEDLQRKDEVLSRISAATSGQAHINPQHWPYVIAFATSRSPKRQVTKYSTTGFFGRHLFITDKIKIERGEIIESPFPLLAVEEASYAKKIQFCFISEKALKELLSVWLPKILKMGAKGQVSVVHGFYASSILDGLTENRHKYFFVLVGPSGLGKTELVRATYLLFADTFGEDSLISAGATPMSIEAHGHKLKDLPMPIDDAKYSAISNLSQFRRILQNHCDGTGRGRLNADSELKQTTFMRGRPFLNGEESVIGNEPSLAGRSIEMPGEKVEDFAIILSFLSANKNEIRGIIPHFIANLQKFGSISSLQLKREQTKSMFDKELAKGENRDRVIQSITSIFFGLSYFYGWIENQDSSLAPLIKSELRHAKALLIRLGNAQVRAATNMVPAKAFLSAVTESLSSAKHSIAQMKDWGEDQESSQYKSIIGYQQGNSGTIFLLPAVSLAAAKEIHARSGASFDFSLKAIARSLHDGGHIEKHNLDKATFKIRIGNTTVDTWAVKRESLFPESVPAPETTRIPEAEDNIVDLFDSKTSGQG